MIGERGARGALDEASLREPLRRALERRRARRLPAAIGKAAAVLVPLFERDGETRVWLVRRPATMRKHAGQVALPGGKTDPSDGSSRVTALREAEEELGIPAADVDVLGVLDDLPTISGYKVTPWVGWLVRDVEPRPNPHEVARAFHVPLRAFFGRPEGWLPWSGWSVDGEKVWGATAVILRSFVAIARRVDARR